MSLSIPRLQCSISTAFPAPPARAPGQVPVTHASLALLSLKVHSGAPASRRADTDSAREACLTPPTATTRQPQPLPYRPAAARSTDGRSGAVCASAAVANPPDVQLPATCITTRPSRDETSDTFTFGWLEEVDSALSDGFQSTFFDLTDSITTACLSTAHQVEKDKYRGQTPPLSAIPTPSMG